MGRAQAQRFAARVALAAGVAAAWATGAVPHARADEPLTLSWSAPADCPQEAAVRAELERLLGGDSAAGVGVRVQAELAGAVDARFVLVLVVHTDAGEASRRLEGVSCEALTQAGALVIALAIDPDAVAAHAVQAPAETPASPPTTHAVQAPAQTPASPPTTPNHAPPPPTGDAATRLAPPEVPDTAGPTGLTLRGRLLALGLGETLTVPGSSAGLVVGGGLRVGRLDLTLEGLWTSPRNLTVPTPAGAGADFTLLAARLRGCAALMSGAVQLGPCLGVELGRVRGTSHGVSAPASGSAPWTAPIAGVELLVFAHNLLALTARLDLALPLRRPTFVIEGVGAVTALGLVSVRGELGLSLYFP